MCSIMTTREIVQEIKDILEVDTVISTTTIHFEDDQYNRLRFLFTFLSQSIDRAQPADLDRDALARKGILI